jgi:hypothetical protein
MLLFKELNEEETKEFRKWARENYKPNDAISTIWHPVVREECAKMNIEREEQSHDKLG